jgi:hypothetical protein
VAGSPLFDRAAGLLEAASSLDQPSARGTLRLTLRKAGIEPQGMTAAQLVATVRQLLPAELAARGVANPERVCERMAGELADAAPPPPPASHDSVEAIFRRLGGA